MAKTSKKRTRQGSGAERFLKRLGGAPMFALKDIAAALYTANGGKQLAVLEALQSGELIASVHWPDREKLVPLPKELWLATAPEKFSIRERYSGKWREFDYEIRRGPLVRYLLVPKLVAVRRSIVQRNFGESRQSYTQQKLAEDLDLNLDLEIDTVIHALQYGRQAAEVFVLASDATSFAASHLGSVSKRGRGRPKTDHIPDGLVEGFRRLYGRSPRPMQKVFIAEMLEWWNKNYMQRESSFIRNNIARPIWRSLHWPEDEG